MLTCYQEQTIFYIAKLQALYTVSIRNKQYIYETIAKLGVSSWDLQTISLWVYETKRRPDDPCLFWYVPVSILDFASATIILVLCFWKITTLWGTGVSFLYFLLIFLTWDYQTSLAFFPRVGYIATLFSTLFAYTLSLLGHVPMPLLRVWDLPYYLLLGVSLPFHYPVILFINL